MPKRGWPGLLSGFTAAYDAVEFGMTYISGHDRSQILLLPEVVDDYVRPDNPVRCWRTVPAPSRSSFGSGSDIAMRMTAISPFVVLPHIRNHCGRVSCFTFSAAIRASSASTATLADLPAIFMPTM